MKAPSSCATGQRKDLGMNTWEEGRARGKKDTCVVEEDLGVMEEHGQDGKACA